MRVASPSREWPGVATHETWGAFVVVFFCCFVFSTPPTHVAHGGGRVAVGTAFIAAARGAGQTHNFTRYAQFIFAFVAVFLITLTFLWTLNV